MGWCLVKSAVLKFKEALKSGEIDPVKLSQMTSKERRSFFIKYVGEENAVRVNALFESKLLLKNQKAGMISWAKKVAGMSPDVKRDIISRIERLDKVLDPKEKQSFLEDLASTRLKLSVTKEEAKQIYDLANQRTELQKKANSDGVFQTEKDRLEYGIVSLALEKYINELKLRSKEISFKEESTKKIVSGLKQTPGAMKSSVASFDNSFWGRQGIKTLLDIRTSKYWVRTFLRSWVDIGRQLTAKGKIWTSGDDAVMDSIKIDVYSRPNAVNGKYKAGDYGLDVFSEEAYPSSLPEKIPLLGRIFKASEVAYNGGALRLRADLADRLISIAEKQGIDTLNKEEAQGMGQLVSSQTGRGSNYLKLTGEQQAGVNVLFFSIKFLQSNIDTLTAHQFDPKATKFTKREARKNLLSIVASLMTIMTLANLIDPDSVDEDPRSTNFGKIKIWGHWVDITGGMASLVTLISRIFPSWHNGKFGWWMKSSSGNWTDLTSGKYGQQTALDILENFVEGKLSPFAGIVRDILKGQDFQGNPITFKNLATNYTTPISIQNYMQLKNDPASSFILGSMLLDVLGLSVSTYRYTANWEKSTTKEMKQFKEKVGEVQFDRANEDYNRAYSEWYNRISKTKEFKALSEDGKSSLISTAKEKFKNKIFEEYGFKYRKTTETTEDKKEKQQIKKMTPE